MQRRGLIKGAGLVALAAATGTLWWWQSGQSPARVDRAGLRQVLARLKQGRWDSAQGWSPAQVYNHCAQSIEYSMGGYPQLKPEWFRASVGPAAFAVFQQRGAMQHALDEPIPGAASLDAPAGEAAALERLESAFDRFFAHQGPLAPHFAYGALDHGQYATAHILHLYNHLQRLRPA